MKPKEARKFQGCFKEASRTLGKIQGCFKKVSRMHKESFKGVSRKFQGCFKVVSRVLMFDSRELSGSF